MTHSKNILQSSKLDEFFSWKNSDIWNSFTFTILKWQQCSNISSYHSHLSRICDNLSRVSGNSKRSALMTCHPNKRRKKRNIFGQQSCIYTILLRISDRSNKFNPENASDCFVFSQVLAARNAICRWAQREPSVCPMEKMPHRSGRETQAPPVRKCCSLCRFCRYT